MSVGKLKPLPADAPPCPHPFCSVISQASSHNSAEEKNRRNPSEEKGKQSVGEEKHKAGLSEKKPKKRAASVSSERGSKPPLKRMYKQSPRKRGRPPKDEKVCVLLRIPSRARSERVQMECSPSGRPDDFIVVTIWKIACLNHLGTYRLIPFRVIITCISRPLCLVTKSDIFFWLVKANKWHRASILPRTSGGSGDTVFCFCFVFLPLVVPKRLLLTSPSHLCVWSISNYIRTSCLNCSVIWWRKHSRSRWFHQKTSVPHIFLPILELSPLPCCGLWLIFGHVEFTCRTFASSLLFKIWSLHTLAGDLLNVVVNNKVDNARMYVLYSVLNLKVIMKQNNQDILEFHTTYPQSNFIPLLSCTAFFSSQLWICFFSLGI